MKLYRFLTGPDDASFCKRISKALSQGWQLYGNPVLAYHPEQKAMLCGQAVVKEAAVEFSDDIILADQ